MCAQAAPGRAQKSVAVALGAGAGVVLVSQNGINTNLRRKALDDSPVPTAFVSFAIGLVAISALALAHGQLSGVRRDWSLRQAPWYAYLGGVLGPVYVVAAVVISERLGFAAYQLCAILGQVLAALAIDSCGFLGLQRRRPSPLRLVALLTLSSGTALTVEGIGDQLSGKPWWEIGLYSLAATTAGSIFPVQAMCNKAMQAHVHTPFRAVVVSFIGGSTILFSISAVVVTVSGPLDVRPGEAWMWTGGLCGAFIVTGNVIGVPRIGAAAYTAVFVACQLATAFVYDSIGAFEFDTIHPTGRRIAGVLLATASAVAYQLAPSTAIPTTQSVLRAVELRGTPGTERQTATTRLDELADVGCNSSA